MIEDWRQVLYYPLGVPPIVFFALRFLVQWLQSEKQKRSYVSHTFWRISLAGNLLLLLHYIVQVQYPFAILQAGNAVISWRNLNLMNAKKHYPSRTTILVILCAFTTVTLVFFTQSYFFIGEMDWIRTPTKLFDTTRQHHSLVWHLIGATGAALFASRFWVQWWHAERAKRSELTPTFWWLSIVGSIISLAYFIHIRDTISIIPYSFGLIPYLRNLVLQKQANTINKRQ